VEDRVARPERAAESGAVEDVRPDRLHLGGPEPVEARLIPIGHAYGAERLRRKFCQVRADEPGGAGDTDAHNFDASGLFISSYTQAAP
jgi:hypothetical protein